MRRAARAHDAASNMGDGMEACRGKFCTDDGTLRAFASRPAPTGCLAAKKDTTDNILYC